MDSANRLSKQNREDGTFFNKILKFFSNKWTRRGFSLAAAGYVWFLGWVAWLTFAYHFVFDNAATVFLLYTFVNVMFSIAMVYTRREILTKIASLILHLLVLVMLVYGFGNWFLILPPFLAAAVVFFASGVSESLKVILGTIYMILFVLAFLAYVTLQNLTIQIPFKMELHLRETPNVEFAYRDSVLSGNPPPFRLVAYVDPETKANRTASFYIERTDLDISMWNLTCERVFGSVRAGTLSHEREFELRWVAPDMLLFDGRLIEIDEDGQIITVDNDDDFHETEIISDD
ncbi:MAG: hypothetical protein FWH07_02230 [Oscillospiraceae bacterium]|nr:hypothetical protein [Oscillospiraceae bacterium]